MVKNKLYELFLLKDVRMYLHDDLGRYDITVKNLDGDDYDYLFSLIPHQGKSVRIYNYFDYSEEYSVDVMYRIFVIVPNGDGYEVIEVKNGTDDNTSVGDFIVLNKYKPVYVITLYEEKGEDNGTFKGKITIYKIKLPEFDKWKERYFNHLVELLREIVF